MKALSLGAPLLLAMLIYVPGAYAQATVQTTVTRRTVIVVQEPHDLQHQSYGPWADSPAFSSGSIAWGGRNGDTHAEDLAVPGGPLIMSPRRGIGDVTSPSNSAGHVSIRTQGNGVMVGNSGISGASTFGMKPDLPAATDAVQAAAQPSPLSPAFRFAQERNYYERVVRR